MPVSKEKWSVCLAAVIEYFIYELLDITLDKAIEDNNYILSNPYFLIAIYEDPDMKEFLQDIKFII